MKLVLLAPRNSTHTVRWANAFAARGHDVHVISSHSGGSPLDQRITVHPLPHGAPLGYFTNAPRLRKLLKQLAPDVMNVHYASGYGLLGFLSGFHPLCLNVWGSDVYDFPYRNPLNRILIRKVLKGADQVASTSQVMAEQTRSLGPTRRPIEVTPFGVDTQSFAPKAKDGKAIVVGTIKLLAPIYGQDILIDAFSAAVKELEASRPDVAAKMRLLIVGDGPIRAQLEEQAKARGIAPRTTFTGAVEHQEIPAYLNEMDVFVAVTRVNESFGVAVVEASSAGLPVIVSDVPGFREVVDEGKTGLIVPRDDVEATKEAIKKLASSADARVAMGKAGRERVQCLYEWSACVDRLEGILRKL